MEWTSIEHTALEMMGLRTKKATRDMMASLSEVVNRTTTVMKGTWGHLV